MAYLDEEENIRMRAYLLWEAKGQLNIADSYWHQARQLIDAEHSAAYPPPQSLPRHDL